MRFQPKRVVHVTTREALDAALKSADQVIVEGDEKLLSYAASRAARDPEASDIDIQIGSVSAGRDAFSAPEEAAFAPPRAGEPVYPALPPPAAAPPPGAAARRPSPWFIAGLAIAFGVVLGAAWFFLWATHNVTYQLTEASRSPAISGGGGGGGVVSPHPSPPPQPTSPASNGIPQALQSLAWPVVAIVAIVALFFIARQAIAGGRNVEISWKVTEKVTGRVVITKVRSRTDSARSAA